MTNQSVSAFVLDAAADRARDVLDHSSTTDLDTQRFNHVLRVLDAPYEPSPALRRAATAATIVDLLGTDDGRDIEFEPRRLGVPERPLISIRDPLASRSRGLELLPLAVGRQVAELLVERAGAQWS